MVIMHAISIYIYISIDTFRLKFTHTHRFAERIKESAEKPSHSVYKRSNATILYMLVLY